MTGTHDSRALEDAFLDDPANVLVGVEDVTVTHDANGRPTGCQQSLHGLHTFERFVGGRGLKMCELIVFRVNEGM